MPGKLGGAGGPLQRPASAAVNPGAAKKNMAAKWIAKSNENKSEVEKKREEIKEKLAAGRAETEAVKAGAKENTAQSAEEAKAER